MHSCTVRSHLVIFLRFTQHTKDELHFSSVRTKMLFSKIIVKIKEHEWQLFDFLGQIRHKYWVTSNGTGMWNFALIFMFFILKSPFTIESFNLNTDTPKIPILLQLRNSPQVWKSSRNDVTTLTDVLFPDPLSPIPSAFSNMNTPGPSTSLL